jgi:hypothetical protein
MRAAVGLAALLAAAMGSGSAGNGQAASVSSGASGSAGGASVSVAGSAGINAAAPAATFSDVYAMLFPRTTNAHCDMCHGLPPFDQSNGNLFTGMDRASTYAALVGKPSTSSMCGGRVFVVAGHPEQSLLLQKVMASPPCGLRMPNGGAALSDTQTEMIRSWIAGGALDD